PRKGTGDRTSYRIERGRSGATATAGTARGRPAGGAAGRIVHGSGDVIGSVVDRTCHATDRISGAVREVGGAVREVGRLPGRGSRCRNSGAQRVDGVELNPGTSAAGKPSEDKRSKEQDGNRRRLHPDKAVPRICATKPPESREAYETAEQVVGADSAPESVSQGVTPRMKTACLR